MLNRFPLWCRELRTPKNIRSLAFTNVMERSLPYCFNGREYTHSLAQWTAIKTRLGAWRQRRTAQMIRNAQPVAMIIWKCFGIMHWMQHSRVPCQDYSCWLDPQLYPETFFFFPLLTSFFSLALCVKPLHGNSFQVVATLRPSACTHSRS